MQDISSMHLREIREDGIEFILPNINTKKIIWKTWFSLLECSKIKKNITKKNK